jgi:integrase
MLAQGVPELVAMSILGHTNPNMTRRYQHIPAEVRRQAADLIDEALGQTERGES